MTWKAPSIHYCDLQGIEKRTINMGIRETLKKFEDNHPLNANLAREAISELGAREITIRELERRLGELHRGRESKERKHSHYFKPCPFSEVDVYRVLELFNVTNPAIAHALKKLLVAGGRGAGKDISTDIQEAIDTLERWKEMQHENKLINAVP